MATTSTLEQLGILTGVVAGVGGMVLGVLNTIQQHRDSRPRLRVLFLIRTAINWTNGPGGAVEHGVGIISIANPGQVNVVPNIVGIKCRGAKHLLVMTPRSVGGGELTEELRPGHQRMLRFDPQSLLQQAQGKRAVRAFVTTQVGDEFTGSRKELRTFLAELREYDKSAP